MSCDDARTHMQISYSCLQRMFVITRDRRRCWNKCKREIQDFRVVCTANNVFRASCNIWQALVRPIFNMSRPPSHRNHSGYIYAGLSRARAHCMHRENNKKKIWDGSMWKGNRMYTRQTAKGNNKQNRVIWNRHFNLTSSRWKLLVEVKFAVVVFLFDHYIQLSCFQRSFDYVMVINIPILLSG